MTLAESVAGWVLRVLPYDKSNVHVVTALRQKHPAELLVLYLNWQSRLISEQPREVMRSAEFDRNQIAANRSTTVTHIVRDIEHGNDLTKYLSRRVRAGFVLPSNPIKKQLKKLRHLDLLLNDWQIHHLHLSDKVEEDGFLERDDPLLFAMFQHDKAYLLDIGTHSTFADDRLPKIAIENWPHAQLFVELMGILGPREGAYYTNEERKKMRSAGVASVIQINGRMFSPPCGISTAGTSAQTAIEAGRVMRALKKFEEQVVADPSAIVNLISQHGGQAGNRPEFEFSFFMNGFGVIEKTSGIPIGLKA